MSSTTDRQTSSPVGNPSPAAALTIFFRIGHWPVNPPSSSYHVFVLSSPSRYTLNIPLYPILNNAPRVLQCTEVKPLSVPPSGLCPAPRAPASAHSPWALPCPACVHSHLSHEKHTIASSHGLLIHATYPFLMGFSLLPFPFCNFFHSFDVFQNRHGTIPTMSHLLVMSVIALAPTITHAFRLGQLLPIPKPNHCGRW